MALFTLCCSVNFFLALCVVTGDGRPALTPAGRTAHADDATAEPKQYAQGLYISWQDRSVEVDARVVLREGPLELLACTPGTREHESIVAVMASATRLFQALGLIGLRPGHPVQYDEANDRLIPPTGDRLQLLIRYRREGVSVTHDVQRWLASAETRKPVSGLGWVFAGSRKNTKNELAVETEGTVVAVVDFDSALISVDSLHTSANEALWLVANTEAIPPVGTPCRLLIRSATRNVAVVLHVNGALLYSGKQVTASDVAKLARPTAADERPVQVLLQHDPRVEGAKLQAVRTALVAAGIDASAIRTETLVRSGI